MTTDTPHFDAIVVGSGFGGSVAAYRLAHAGLRVCVLERGRAYPPGSFPRDPQGMARNFWDPSEGLHGLFNIWSFKGIEAVVSSGLGGGSLIYANVLIRKDEHWFVEDHAGDGTPWSWPITRADLDPHYDAVERMLGATPFPFGASGYDTPKTGAMRHAAERLDLEWRLPNLAVTFGVDGRPPGRGEAIPPPEHGNIHDRPRLTCRMCGECDVGCNDGAKNTLDHTYLSAAAHHGAQVRTRCEVRRLAPRESGGFTVGYVEHDARAEGQPTATSKLPVTEITADRLIMAAGALGTSYLLLRNRSAFPALGRSLGTRFSGNGDLLGFLSGATTADGEPWPLDASSAPVITSTIRMPDRLDGGTGRGFYLQDAGYPGFADWLIEAAGAPRAAKRALRFALQRVWARIRRDPRSDLGAAMARMLGDGSSSATSMPLLGMGRDIPDGVMSLRRGHLAVDWTTETSAEFFESVRATMRDVAGALGARFNDNPTYALRRVVTVHPLGGAPMGHHAEEGVVDAHGESFAYPGLYVLDGAAIPGPVGPNPALTIAAFADRACDRLLETRAATVGAGAAARAASGGSGDGRGAATATGVTGGAAAAGSDLESGRVPPDDAVDDPGSAGSEDGEVTSVWFTEQMKGHVAIGEDDPSRGLHAGRQAGTSLMFELTIRMDDIDNFVSDPMREGSATGWIDCDRLGGRLPVEHGVFNLFVTEDDPDRRRMLYRLYFADSVGHPLTLSGFKDVHDGPGFDVWSDTSTLYVTILGGHVGADEEEGAPVVASGVLRILKADFVRQLTTFRTAGPNPAARARGLARFGRLFLGELWNVYGPNLPGGGRS